MRVLSALVLGPLALLCAWAGGPAWTALLALCVLGLGWEWSRLCGAPALRPPAIGLPLVLLVSLGFAAFGHRPAALVALAAGCAIIGPAAWMRGTPRGLLLTAGIPYLGLAALSLLALREGPAEGAVGRGNLFFLLLVVWASDIGAYLVGRLVGGPRLAPAISPGKTWSGALGGLAAAMLVGLGAAALFDPQPGVPWRAMPVAGVLAALSQAGDLLESAIKRRAGVKDSSKLIPGHGGLFDRVDGVLAAAPAAALLGLILGQGVPLWR
nr:phosphatidate cytidylyltransferase [Roseomonas acroporae]